VVVKDKINKGGDPLSGYYMWRVPYIPWVGGDAKPGDCAFKAGHPVYWYLSEKTRRPVVLPPLNADAYMHPYSSGAGRATSPTRKGGRKGGSTSLADLEMVVGSMLDGAPSAAGAGEGARAGAGGPPVSAAPPSTRRRGKAGLADIELMLGEPAPAVALLEASATAAPPPPSAKPAKPLASATSMRRIVTSPRRRPASPRKPAPLLFDDEGDAEAETEAREEETAEDLF
jgi:hypothetical protein